MSFVLVLMCTALVRLYEDTLVKTKTREKKHFCGDEKKRIKIIKFYYEPRSNSFITVLKLKGVHYTVKYK